MFIDPRLFARKAQLIGVLEHMCQSLELTDTQAEQARRSYQGAGEWLAASPDPGIVDITGKSGTGAFAVATVIAVKWIFVVPPAGIIGCWKRIRASSPRCRAPLRATRLDPRVRFQPRSSMRSVP